MTALRDLLDLPAHVTKSAFVVRLVEGVSHPDALLDRYAITPDLHGAFDRALGFVGTALRERRNVAAFVHGSFGSGKSHFMGVLSLLLANDPRPWAEPALHDLLGKHEWVKQRKVLRLHFNLMGARSLDEKVFAEYLARIRELHPDAPIAPLFEDQALFDNAQAMRETLGDPAFFDRLGAGASGDTRWGKKGAAAAWDADRFDAARASVDPDERARLFSALVKTLFPAFAKQSSRYLSFDQGLPRLAQHAAGLGYDAVVVFLDELILWLASGASNREWLNLEIGKLAKMVEGQSDDQRIPIATFAARQRDIGEMVGEQYAGADAEAVKTALKWWEGRFDVLKLEDRNLPAIVEKRVVRPKSEAARRELDTAFDRLRASLGNVAWGTLLGEIGDENGFRRVYPFSPALVEALVAMSHYLQRERTALKVLVELLVEHMADFEIGKVVPVGDLYDVLAGGEEPMDGAMRERFAAARRLYANELLPVIQRANETGGKERCQRERGDHPVTLGCSNCREARCRADNRLAKTLLLAALVPNSAVFRGLTASRVVQLNHGTLKSPVPGAEAQQALSRIRAWAAECGKVRVGDQPTDPTVSIVLEGVDLKPIIDAARGYDSGGTRRAKLREILFGAIGIEMGNGPVVHTVPWRGTDRIGAVHYGNVREMDDGTLHTKTKHDFKLIIDYPFDDPGRTPQEDEARLRAYTERYPDTPTLVWLPSFFAETPQRDLADLVVIDRILEGDSWKTHLQNLRPDDQSRARAELTSLASQKRERVKRALNAAYGLARPEAAMLDAGRSVDQHFHVLLSNVRIPSLVVASMKDGVIDVVGQLQHELHPRHPHFDVRVTKGKLAANLEQLQKLYEAEGQRLLLAKSERDALYFAEKLGLVNVNDGQATLQPLRFQEAENALRAQGIDTPTVAQVRRVFDTRGVLGLTPEVEDFLVLAYAIATGRELMRLGTPVRDPSLGKLGEDLELPKPPMPDPVSFQKALDRAGVIFGVSLGGRALHARNLRALGDKLGAAVAKATTDRAAEVASLLARRGAAFSDEPHGTPPRLLTARKVAELLGGLGGDPLRQVTALASLEVAPTSETAMQKHLLSARATAECLDDDLVFQSLEALRGHEEAEAREMLAEAREMLAKDELHAPLAAPLRALALKAQAWMRKHRRASSSTPPPPVGEVVGSGSAATLDELEAERARMLEALKSAGPEGRLLLSCSWKVVRGKP
jgi:hypothetical protein